MLIMLLSTRAQPGRGTCTVKAVTTLEEAEKLIALGYEFHCHAQDGANLFRKKVMGLD